MKESSEAEKCPLTLTAFRFGESLYWAAIEHQHQYPRARPKEPHSSLLPLLSAGNSLALGPWAVAFVKNEKESKKLAGTGAGARRGRGAGRPAVVRAWRGCSSGGPEQVSRCSGRCPLRGCWSSCAGGRGPGRSFTPLAPGEEVRRRRMLHANQGHEDGVSDPELFQSRGNGEEEGRQVG